MIDTLIDRLRWPAALVRERAASQIGELIVEEHPGVCEQLLLWIESQELESLAAIGLLPFIYAAARGGQRIPEASDLASVVQGHFSAVGNVSELILDPSYAIRPTIGRHSETSPSNWRKPDRVSDGWPSKYESRLCDWLLNYEGISRRPLINQFEYEISVLRNLHGGSPLQAFWSQGGPRKRLSPRLAHNCT